MHARPAHERYASLPWLSVAMTLAALATIYFGSAQLGLSLASAHHNVSLIWPAAGIALAAVLLLGYWVWPAITLGAFLANAATDVSLFTAGGIAVGNTLEALGGAFLVRRLIGDRNPLDQAQDVFRFVGSAVLLSTMVSATIGTASLCLGMAASWSDYGQLWGIWWLGDAAGALVVTPAVLAWNARRKIARAPRQVAEVALLLVLLTLVSYTVFTGWISVGVTDLPLAYLPVPFLIWTAVRFHQRTMTTAILLSSGIAIWGTAHGLGPFARGTTLNESFFLLHTFVGITAVMSLVLAAVTAERDQAEETMRESQEQYKLLVEQARDIIYRTDAQGNFTFVNPTAFRIMGYSKQELLGRRFTELIHPDAREAAERFYGRQLARKTPSTYYEFPAITKDGRDIWLGQNVQVSLENDHVVGVHAMARDITERKVMEQTLQASENQFRTLTNFAPVGIYFADPQGNCLLVNERWAELAGLSPEEAKGRGWIQALYPEDRERVLKEWDDAAQAGHEFHGEYRFQTRNGAINWLSGRAITVRDSKDTVTGYIGSVTDITERKRAEAAWQESEMQMRLFMEATADCVWNWDMVSARITRNTGFEKAFGYAKEEIVPSIDWWAERLHRDDRQRVLTTHADAVASGLPTFIYEYRFRRRNGSYAVVSDHVFIVRDGTGKVVRELGAMTDITERKQAEDQRSQRALVIEQSLNEIYIFHAQTLKFQTVNLGARKNLGYTMQELSTLTPLDLKPEYSPESFAELIRPLRTGKKRLIEFNTVHRRKDSSTYPVEVHLQLQRIHSGEVFVAIILDITARKQAEEETQRARAFLDSIVENIPNMIFVKDATNLKFVRFNKAGETLLGYGRDELIGKSDRDFFPKQEADFFTAKDRAVLDSRQFLDIPEEPIKTKNLGVRILHTKKIPLLDKEGRPQYLLGISEDITERKRAEEALRMQARVLESMLEGVSLSDENGVIRHTNPAEDAMFGYEPGELIGKHVTVLNAYPSDENVRIVEGVIKQLKVTGFWEGEFNNRRKDGTLFTTFARITALEMQEKRYWVCVQEDITERKRAEKTLRESEAFKNRILDSSPDCIKVLDLEGRLLFMNKGGQELMDICDITPLLNSQWVEFYTGEDKARARAALEAARSGTVGRFIGFCPTATGKPKWWDVFITPLFDANGVPDKLLSISRDITERKRTEAALRERSRQQAIEAELSLLAAMVQDLPSLLNTAVQMVLNALEVDYCEVLELLPDGSKLQLCASAGWKGDRIGHVRAVEAGSLTHAALQSSRPAVRVLPDDTRFGGPPWLYKHGAVGGMNVNIPGKENPWGALGVYSAGTRAFSRDDINFLQTVSSILATAIERMQAESVLKDANQALRLLSRQLLQVQEEDRRAIARDLHDEIGQSLTAIKLNVERAQRTSDRDARARIMQDCAQITERVLGQVRDLSLDLHPSILDDLGLAYALKWYANRQAERAGLKVEVTADPSLPRLSPDIEIACFRIAQEALTNVVRHAQARFAGITLKRGATAVELCIQDDGIGFIVSKTSFPANGGASVGLASMQERAKLLGGTVKITSAPRHGTKVIAMLPLVVASPAGMPKEEVPRS